MHKYWGNWSVKNVVLPEMNKLIQDKIDDNLNKLLASTVGNLRVKQRQ